MTTSNATMQKVINGVSSLVKKLTKKEEVPNNNLEDWLGPESLVDLSLQLTGQQKNELYKDKKLEIKYDDVPLGIGATY